MAWLLSEGRVISSLEIATTRRERLRGLLGRDGTDGALMLQKTRSVHTFGMFFSIDVAHCDANLQVLRVTTMKPGRIGRFVPRARVVIEAEAGAFQRWGIKPGVDSRFAVRRQLHVGIETDRR